MNWQIQGFKKEIDVQIDRKDQNTSNSNIISIFPQSKVTKAHTLLPETFSLPPLLDPDTPPVPTVITLALVYNGPRSKTPGQGVGGEIEWLVDKLKRFCQKGL